MAFYGLATLVPIGVLIISLLGFVLGDEAKANQLVDRVDGFVSEEVAAALETALTEIDAAVDFADLTIISTTALVVTASILFVAWKDALDAIWGPRRESGAKTTLLNRLFGIVGMGVLAALLIAMLVVEALLGMLNGLFSDDVVVDTVFRIGSSIAPFIVAALLLALLYRFGTERRASWKAVWRGTAMTMALLLLASWAYGIYLDLNGASVVSLASSAIVLMMLVYLTAQVLLYGAEFIKVWQRRNGS